MKPRIREAIVVEGRYDKNTVSQAVEAVILETGGFGVFSDGEKLALLRRLAEKRGVIILTDSDGAGFVIRSYLKGALPMNKVKQAYIPDVPGKERRKRTASREGKLGVEGMSPEVILQSLRRAGATFEGENPEFPEPELSGPERPPITKADLYEWGLTGTQDASERRKTLLRRLNLPEKLSANALLEVLNALYDREELDTLIASIDRRL